MHNSYTRLIDKVVCGQNLSASESEKVFTKVFLDDKEGYCLTAFCAALHAKGETSEELLGLCRATAKLGVKIQPEVNQNLLIDLAGTGGGKVKTINVSTAASLVVASLGYVVAKQAGYAVTSPTGSADIFEAFGVDVFKLSLKQIENALEEVGVCPYFLPAISPKMKNRSQVARRVFVDNKLRIHSPFHIAAFAYSPTRLKTRIYGCYSNKHLDVLGELFIKLGNKRTLIVHGIDGIPEVSNVGSTLIVEQYEKKLKRYLVNPKVFGIKKAKLEDILSGGRKQNIIDFIKVLSGQEKGPKQDIVAINASVALYCLERVASFKEGTKLAKEVINNGTAYKKFEELINMLGDSKLLAKWELMSRVV